MQTKPDICSLLKGVDLLSALDEADLQQIASVSVLSKFRKNEMVVWQNIESEQALYIIASGKVQVYIAGSDNRETILSFLEKGDFFGEISLFDNLPSSASVRTLTETQLLVIKQTDFLQLLEHQPGMARGLLIEMAKRLRRTNKQVVSLSTMSVYGRVASTLLELVEEQGVRVHLADGKKVTVIRNRPTHNNWRICPEQREKRSVAFALNWQGKELFP